MRSKLAQFVRILLAVMVCGGWGNVLCCSSDGRVIVERIVHEHCRDDHQHDSKTHPDTTAGAFEAIACHPCVDVPLTTDREPLRILPLFPLASARPVLWAAEGAVRINGWVNRVHTESLPYFKPLETIVLLT